MTTNDNIKKQPSALQPLFDVNLAKIPHEMKQAQFTPKNVWGKELLYPMNAAAAHVMTLLGTKTLAADKRQLTALKELNIQVMVFTAGSHVPEYLN